jgi:hypothetical protein
MIQNAQQFAIQFVSHQDAILAVKNQKMLFAM